MALTLDLDPKPAPQWVSNRRICLTAEGALCEADDSAANTLLVAEGGSIPLDVAVRYGLANLDGSTIQTATAEEKKPKAAAPKAPAKPAAPAPATTPTPKNAGE